MRLVPLSDLKGQAMYWVNPEHISMLQPVVSTTGREWTVDADVKIQGLPLMRCRVGSGAGRE